MTAPTTKIFTVGLNAARIYALDQDSGWINGSVGATAYNGFSVGGPTTFTYEPPDPDSIVHPGNNTILQRDSLPSQDVSSASLEVSRTDMDTIALLSNTKVRVFGDINSIGWGSNQQGTEPTVAFLTYAQAKTPAGVRCWSTFVFPKTTIIPKPKGQSREQQNHKYFVQPNIVTAHLTGIAATIADDGFTATEVFEYQSNYRLTFDQWITAAAAVDYTFDTLLPYTNNGAGGIVVTKNGVKMTYGVTADATHYIATATKITFGAALTNGDVIVAMREIAESAVDVS